MRNVPATKLAFSPFLVEEIKEEEEEVGKREEAGKKEEVGMAGKVVRKGQGKSIRT